MDTLNGGRKVTVLMNDGSQKEILVAQLKLKQYSDAFKIHEDELKLGAFICGMKEDEFGEINPEAYEELRVQIQEVNAKGFFVWLARTSAEVITKMKQMDIGMMKAFMDKPGKALSNQQSDSPRGLQPRAG